MQRSLLELQIIDNELQNEALEILGQVVFRENRQIRKLVLSNNLIGEGPREKELMTLFLENFLLELDSPQHLDLSYNRISDESLYPIVKYLLANTECHINILSLEMNSLSNYAKRTIA